MTNIKARDEADIASEQEQFARDEAIWRCKHSAPSRSNGRCYNCGEACDSIFCDVFCRQDYERRQRMEARTHAQQQGGRWPLLRLPATAKRKAEEQAQSDHHRDEYNTFERDNDRRERKDNKERYGSEF